MEPNKLSRPLCADRCANFYCKDGVKAFIKITSAALTIEYTKCIQYVDRLLSPTLLAKYLCNSIL